MSQYYMMCGETLWNPSNGASHLFQRQVALFEEELGLPSGIGPMESDECRIDPAVFAVFANTLLTRYRQSQHAVIRALTEGFAVTILALAERAGVELRWEPPAPEAELRDAQVLIGVGRATWGDDLHGKVTELDRFMAR